MGQSMSLVDGSLQHSFDNSNHGEPAAEYTCRLLERMTKHEEFDVINHIGDISYATGELALWDTFLHETEKVAAETPWMVAIGNHEIGWKDSDLQGSDSQGECGVPYMSLFPYAQRNPLSRDITSSSKTKLVDYFAMNREQAKSSAIVEPYYSFQVKNVYVLMMSTEHDVTPGSAQIMWIEEELKFAASLVSSSSSEVAWILFLGHRPMYISDKYMDKSTRHLRRFVEPLLQKYGVDIAMWGHHHSYQRFKCKLFNGKCDEKGTVQIVSGHAGFDHSPFSHSEEYEDLFAVKNNKDWGVSTLDFRNATHCFVQYRENQNGEVLDSFVVAKNRLELV